MRNCQKYIYRFMKFNQKLVPLRKNKKIFNKMKILLFAVLTLFALPSVAQDENNKFDSLKMQQYIDSLYSFRERLYGIPQQTNSTVMSSYSQYRLFSPITFYHSVANNNLGLKKTWQDIEEQEVGNALLNIYMNYPQLVSNSENVLRQLGIVKEEITAPIQHHVDLVKEVEPLPKEKMIAPVDVVVLKPNFWTIKGDYYLQFLQNYVSSNWYKGGESNYSMVGSIAIDANYNNKSKVKWDNKLEMKLGFQTSRADSLHSLKTSEDLLRLTSKLGLQASKHWYYTLNVVAYTQFMRGYKNNDVMIYSDVMSPFNLNVSLGMNYTVEWLKKRLTGNIQLSPIAYNFKYVDRLALATRYGLDEGHHALHDFGSMLTVSLKWKFSDNMNWETRLYCYSTYHRAELEWENTLTFQFNKYISTKLFLYPRFDDAATRDDSHGYWQFKEFMSLGFNYSF